MGPPQAVATHYKTPEARTQGLRGSREGRARPTVGVHRSRTQRIMAKPTPELIDLLRRTAARLEGGASYQWGHLGSCNCGHLAQEVTSLSADELMRRAKGYAAEWNELVVDTCRDSGLPFEWVIDQLMSRGLEREDLAKLEYLSDRRVLARIPLERRRMIQRQNRDDVVLYLRAWAGLLVADRDARELATPMAAAELN